MKKKLFAVVALLCLVSFGGMLPTAEGQLYGDYCDRYDTLYCDYSTSDDLCCRGISGVGAPCGRAECW